MDGLIARVADVQLSLSTLMLAIIALALVRAGLGGETLGRFAVPLLVLGHRPCRMARISPAPPALPRWSKPPRTMSAPPRRLGAGDAAIIRRHILPNILSPLIVVATTQVAGAIMAEAALSFLGLGLPITQPSLGTLIRSGYDLIFAGIWWVTVLPGLTLVSVLVAVNILGDGASRCARPAPDPTLRWGRRPNHVDNRPVRPHDSWKGALTLPGLGPPIWAGSALEI